MNFLYMGRQCAVSRTVSETPSWCRMRAGPQTPSPQIPMAQRGKFVTPKNWLSLEPATILAWPCVVVGAMLRLVAITAVISVRIRIHTGDCDNVSRLTVIRSTVCTSVSIYAGIGILTCLLLMMLF
jgi:hypothetical protein